MSSTRHPTARGMGPSRLRSTRCRWLAGLCLAALLPLGCQAWSRDADPLILEQAARWSTEEPRIELAAERALVSQGNRLDVYDRSRARASLTWRGSALVTGGSIRELDLDRERACLLVGQGTLQVIEILPSGQPELRGSLAPANLRDWACSGARIWWIEHSTDGGEQLVVTGRVEGEQTARVPLPSPGMRMTVSDGLAYLVAADGGIAVLDPSSMTLDWTAQRIDPAIAAGIPRVIGSSLVLPVRQTDGIWLRTYDLQDERQPRLRGQLRIAGELERIDWVGGTDRLAVLRSDRTGTRLIDVSDPAQPRELGVPAAMRAAEQVAGDDRLIALSGKPRGIELYDGRRPRDLRDPVILPYLTKPSLIDAAGPDEPLLVFTSTTLNGAWGNTYAMHLLDPQHLEAPSFRSSIEMLGAARHVVRDESQLWTWGNDRRVPDAFSSGSVVEKIDLRDDRQPKHLGGGQRDTELRSEYDMTLLGREPYFARGSSILRASRDPRVGPMGVQEAYLSLTDGDVQAIVTIGNQLLGGGGIRRDRPWARARRGWIAWMQPGQGGRASGLLSLPSPVTHLVTDGEMAYAALESGEIHAIEIEGRDLLHRGQADVEGRVTDLEWAGDLLFVAGHEMSLTVIDLSRARSPKARAVRDSNGAELCRRPIDLAWTFNRLLCATHDDEILIYRIDSLSHDSQVGPSSNRSIRTWFRRP